MAANDGIKRGDRADTGDLAADFTDNAGPGGSGVHGGGSSGPGRVTAESSALAESQGTMRIGGDPDFGALGDAEDMDGMSVLDASDPSLGLTGIGDVPAEDWAADIGPSQNDQGGRGAATDSMADLSSTLDPRHRRER